MNGEQPIDLWPKLKAMTDAIDTKKAEILAAFIAKHGFEPDECEIVTETSDTQWRWFVRKREAPR
jgi:hypothetical protein